MEVRCLTCGAFMSRESEDRERFRREVAMRVFAGLVTDRSNDSACAEWAVSAADTLIAKLEKPEAKP